MRELLGRLCTGALSVRPEPGGLRVGRYVAAAQDGAEGDGDQQQRHEAHRGTSLLAAAPRQLVVVGDSRSIPRHARRQPNVFHGRRHRQLQPPALRARRPHAKRANCSRCSTSSTCSASAPASASTTRSACCKRSRTSRSTNRSAGIAATCRGPARTRRSTKSGGRTSRATALRLMLTGKTWAEAADILKERYERSYKRITQLTARRRLRDLHERGRAQHGSAFELSVAAPERGIPDSDEPVLRRHRRVAAARRRLRQGHEHHSGRAGADRRSAEAGGPHHRRRRRRRRRARRRDRLAARRRRAADSRPGRHARAPAGAAGRCSARARPRRPSSSVRDKIKLEEQAAKKSSSRCRSRAGRIEIGVITRAELLPGLCRRSRGDEDYTSTSRDVTRLHRRVQEAEGGIDGLVMDLRANGGGHLSEATELSGLFIDRGPVVQLRETRGNIPGARRPEPDGDLRRPAGRAGRPLQRERVGDLRGGHPGLRTAASSSASRLSAKAPSRTCFRSTASCGAPRTASSR